MSKRLNVTDEWRPCPSGALGHFAGQERGRQRRVLLTKAVATAGVLVLGIGIGYFAATLRKPTEPMFGGVACSTVRSHATQFMSGDLDAALADKIRIHLEECPDCQKLLQEMSGSMKQTSRRSAHDSGETCDCPSCQQRALVAREFRDLLPNKTLVAASNQTDSP